MPLPNFLIIGAPRSGTTSLYEWLRQHPDVFMPTIKEPSFFAFEDGSTHETIPIADTYVRDISSYRALFSGSEGFGAVGEASTLYIHAPGTIERIKGSLDSSRIKIVVILRHPSDRAYSHYILHRSMNLEPFANFRDALDAEETRAREGWRINWNYRDAGMYGQHLASFYRHFSSDQIKVIPFERLNSESTLVLKELCQFLGIDPAFEFDTSCRHNASGVPYNPTALSAVESALKGLGVIGRRIVPAELRARIWKRVEGAMTHQTKISPEDRQFLIDYYQDDIKATESLLGWDLKHWYRSEKPTNVPSPRLQQPSSEKAG